MTKFVIEKAKKRVFFVKKYNLVKKSVFSPFWVVWTLFLDSRLCVKCNWQPIWHYLCLIWSTLWSIVNDLKSVKIGCFSTKMHFQSRFSTFFPIILHFTILSGNRFVTPPGASLLRFHSGPFHVAKCCGMLRRVAKISATSPSQFEMLRNFPQLCDAKTPYNIADLCGTFYNKYSSNTPYLY